MDGFGSLKGFWGMVRGNFRKYPDSAALKALDEPTGHEPAVATIGKSACGVGGSCES
jgi:hypothetical protein